MIKTLSILLKQDKERFVVYEVSTHFDPEGSRCVLQQFRDLILSEELLENRIIAENAKAQ